MPRAGEFEAWQTRAVEWAAIGVKSARNQGHPWHQFKEMLGEEWQLAFLISRIIRDEGGPISEMDALTLVRDAGGLCQYVREQVEGMSKTKHIFVYNFFFEGFKKKSHPIPSEDSSLPPAETCGAATQQN